MKLKITLLLILLVFLGAWFLLRVRSPVELSPVKVGDLELSFSVPYFLELTKDELRSQNDGQLYPLVGEGEKVRENQEICLVQGERTITYKAPVGGLVSFRARGEVQKGDLLCEVLLPEGSIRLDLYPEQAKKLQGKSYIELKYDFSPQMVWGELASLEKKGDVWEARLIVRDYLSQLSKAESGTVFVYYDRLEDVALVPMEALVVEDGEIGIKVKNSSGLEFLPVTILGHNQSFLAVSNINPDAKVVLER